MDQNDSTAELFADLQQEKQKRIRAERDAIWKDISFSVAHKLGNPIFAIETSLDPLQRRVADGRIEEAIVIIEGIRGSIERAKGIIDQFKSLARVQETWTLPTLLLPIIQEARTGALTEDIICKVDCPEDIQVEGDPDRLAECFAELFANALHWFDKPTKEIHVRAQALAPTPLPANLDPGLQYVLIEFQDNGRGVSIENKTRIFDAFFTTHGHGTGLGLALARRSVEAQSGTILERGFPGEGACFAIYLPTPDRPIDRSPEIARLDRETKGQV